MGEMEDEFGAEKGGGTGVRSTEYFLLGHSRLPLDEAGFAVGAALADQLASDLRMRGRDTAELETVCALIERRV